MDWKQAGFPSVDLSYNWGRSNCLAWRIENCWTMPLLSLFLCTKMCLALWEIRLKCKISLCQHLNTKIYCQSPFMVTIISLKQLSGLKMSLKSFFALSYFLLSVFLCKRCRFVDCDLLFSMFLLLFRVILSAWIFAKSPGDIVIFCNTLVQPIKIRHFKMHTIQNTIHPVCTCIKYSCGINVLVSNCCGDQLVI